MSYRIKLPPKNQPPDAQLRSGIEHAFDVLHEYRRGISVGVGVLLVAVVALLAVGWYDHRNAQAALELARQATRLYLDRPADQPAKADDNLKKAVELYRQIVDQYPHTPVTPLALYHLGNAQVQFNDIGGAIETYQRYIARYGTNKTLLGLVYQRLGYAYLLKGDHEQASKAFSAALEVPDALNKDHALFELGKLEETQSRPEGALARYQELAKNYPNSPFTSEAVVRMKALEARKSPGTPEPAVESTPAEPPSSAVPPVKPGQAPLPRGVPPPGQR
jgi:tetratricopeptide (TPR) repeat protein